MTGVMGHIIKAGVAGAGVFGGYHANKYLEADGAELVGIYDALAGRAGEAAEQRGVGAFSDFDAMLEAVDVLTIATPASTHAALAERALKAGVHVLVEKPIALTLDDADRLIAIAKEQNLIIQVGHQERYVAGAFGLFDRAMPKQVVSRRLNKFSGRAMDVSIVYDLMIHDLDLLAILTGADEMEIEEIDAKFVHGETADFVDVTCRLPSGLNARLSASRIEQEPLRDLTIQYEEGEVALNFLTREFSNTTPTPLGVRFDTEDKPLAFTDPLAFGTQTFLNAVREGAEPTVGGRAGRRALKLALQIEEAANAMRTKS